MQQSGPRRPTTSPTDCPVAEGQRSLCVSRLTTRSILRQLIFDEIRDGRLTSFRRRRIIGYATRLGLTAVEIGELITECRRELLESPDDRDHQQALRVVLPSVQRTHTTVRMIGIGIVFIIMELIVLNWWD